MARDEHRLAAVAAADIAGYSRLIGADEEGTRAVLRAHRKELIDPKLAEIGGRIANTAGDSLLIEFRVGINLGDVVAEGDDPMGDGVNVAARHSAVKYTGKAVDLREVGHDLGVDYVLEGSVRRSADTIRVSAQLLDAKDGTHVSADTYDRALDADGVFDIQDELSAGIAEAIMLAELGRIDEAEAALDGALVGCCGTGQT